MDALMIFFGLSLIVFGFVRWHYQIELFSPNDIGNGWFFIFGFLFFLGGILQNYSGGKGK